MSMISFMKTGWFAAFAFALVLVSSVLADSLASADSLFMVLAADATVQPMHEAAAEAGPNSLTEIILDPLPKMHGCFQVP